MEMEKKEEYLQAVWFAAGTAVLMACLKRAALVSLVEQWRLWVFLFLNLLLLAILFTSTCSPDRGIGGAQETSGVEEEAADAAKTDRRAAEEEEEGGGSDSPKLQSKRREDDADADADEEAMKASLLMSKEELNERAEAFIAMFRQRHLVSDANTSTRCRFKTFA